MDKVLVIAPHPDDETLGCGGTLLRHKNDGDEIYWLIVTRIDEEYGWSKEQVIKRSEEIVQVSAAYGFANVYNLALPSTTLDTISISELIDRIGSIMKKVEPNILYMPFIYDVHTDHQVTAKAVNACSKWFRCLSINKVLAYETLSETEFNINNENSFRPNSYVDITKYYQRKIDIMNLYKTEIEPFPFPRSEISIKSLACLRGSQSGYDKAEAFKVLFERY